MNKPDKKEHSLIFSISPHPHIGFQVDAFLVEILANGEFSYSFEKVNSNRLNNLEYEISEEDFKVLKKLPDFSDAFLEKKFSASKPKKIAFWDFIKADKDRNEQVKRYAELQLASYLKLIARKLIFFREKISDHPCTIKLHVELDPAIIESTFSKTELGIDYALQLFLSKQKLKLDSNSIVILSREPAWFKHKNKLIRLEEGVSAARLIPFLTKEVVQIPQKLAYTYMQSFMLKTSRRETVFYEGFDLEDVPGKIEALLNLDEDIQGNMFLRLDFHYDKLSVSVDNGMPFLAKIKPDNSGELKIKRYTRDKAFENKMEARLVELGFQKKLPSLYSASAENQSLEDMINTLSAFAQRFSDADFKLNTQFENNDFYFTKPQLSLAEETLGQDWFDLKMSVQIENLNIPFVRFRNHIIQNTPFFETSDGRKFLIPKEWFTKYRDLFQFSDEDNPEKDQIRIKTIHRSLVEDVIEKKKPERLENPIGEITTPKLLTASLRNYQTEGFNWLYEKALLNQGACLADDMGLGKTIQIIALLCKKKEENQLGELLEVSQGQLNLFTPVDQKITRPTLIVMSPSLIYNWQQELNRFAPSLQVYTHVGVKRSTNASIFVGMDVCLTTYGILRNDISFFQTIPFSTIVLDESQLIKNVRSQNYKAVKSLAGDQKIVLTGTPVENALEDLWAQFSFIQPSLLGNYTFFKKEFASPIEENNDIVALNKLRKLTSSFLLRRTKTQVLKELPPLTRTIRYCEMDEKQEAIYEKHKSAFRNALIDIMDRENAAKGRFMALRGLTILRKLANHPVLEDHSYKGSSAKFTEVITQLEHFRTEKRKVLCFSQFVTHLNLYKNYFDENNIPYSYLTGEIPQAKRKDVIQGFSKGKGFQVFLIQLKTGGTGINLTEADCVFILDPWWNPAAEEQAVSRSHRMGQNSPVLTRHFITKNTIEEKIFKLQQKKTNLATDVLDISNPLQILKEEDLLQLFQ